MDDQEKEKSEHEKLLEKVYQMDSLIAKAAQKLRRLSEDPDIVRQYNEREAYLAQRRLELEKDNEE
ncbi:hypothetical protein [Paenibacillus glycinis]|uniref:Uncharacterized protein n=1 Tax=Paenibacillus glycinis TaxID=2697035 RepID=A0ABW9XTG0_9BACL|nr:hypothetical protein [Paenibacillus glycinis]NBD25631.1 hypothetical protein [Paenibacillus glycinis]